jgi:hypothetical protein
MSRRRTPALVLALCLSAAAAAACRDRDPSRTGGSTGATTGIPAPGAANEWLGELGELLVVPSDSDNTAIVLYPDTPSVRAISAARVLLLEPGGDSVVARLVPAPPDTLQCGDAPRVRIASPLNAAWSVGLAKRTASQLRTDSIETLPSADSARFAADLARLASSIPGAAGSRFHGLPFVVLAARRFVAGGRQIVTGHVVRRLNQEATPLEEHTFLVAERPASAPVDPFVVTYHLRSEGTEESAEHYDMLGALAGRSGPLILIAREQESHASYEILQRDSTAWRVRWARTLSC